MDIRRATTEADQEAVICLFESIALAEGWQPGGQIRAHAERSTYFGVFDGERLIGGLQLVIPDDSGRLPTHQVWPEIPVIEIPSLILHAAVLAILPEYRGKDSAAAFWSLGIALWRHCIESEVKTIYLEATPKMLRCYKLLGWPLEPIGELREHWGEPCYPCSLSVREVAGSLAERALVSTTYRSIFTSALQPTPVLPAIA